MGIRLVGYRLGSTCLALMVVVGTQSSRADSEKPEADRGEKIVALKDLPSAARSAAEKLIAGGALKRIVVEREDGADAYSVEASMAGKNKEFTLAPDGTLLAEEEDVAFEQLPEAVRAAAEKYFAGRNGLRAAKEVAQGVTSYEVEGRRSGKPVSLKFSADGALLEEEEDEQDED
jgi:uncharacterized membrane protein YkoI